MLSCPLQATVCLASLSFAQSLNLHVLVTLSSTLVPTYTCLGSNLVSHPLPYSYVRLQGTGGRGRTRSRPSRTNTSVCWWRRSGPSRPPTRERSELLFLSFSPPWLSSNRVVELFSSKYVDRPRMQEGQDSQREGEGLTWPGRYDVYLCERSQEVRCVKAQAAAACEFGLLLWRDLCTLFSRLMIEHAYRSLFSTITTPSLTGGHDLPLLLLLDLSYTQAGVCRWSAR